jgi:hypothetical protein
LLGNDEKKGRLENESIFVEGNWVFVEPPRSKDSTRAHCSFRLTAVFPPFSHEKPMDPEAKLFLVRPGLAVQAQHNDCNKLMASDTFSAYMRLHVESSAKI